MTRTTKVKTTKAKAKKAKRRTGPDKKRAGLSPSEGEDPAIVAAKEVQKASAAWDAYIKAHPTFADEQTPEWEAAQERQRTADQAFADAPVVSVAGALTNPPAGAPPCHAARPAPTAT